MDSDTHSGEGGAGKRARIKMASIFSEKSDANSSLDHEGRT